MPDADRRLAHEIAAGVLRQRTRLDRWISTHLRRPGQPLDPDVQDVLRIGAYQLAFLDRVPAHAAVNASVELARASASPHRTAFVNAVLRALSREGMPAPDPDDPAGTYSHPQWMVDRWGRDRGWDATLALLEHNNRPPPLVIYAVGGHGPELENALRDRGIPAEPVEFGGWRMATTAVADLPGYDEGWFIVQDPGQRRLLDFADLPSSGLVWDACAAPGGKLLARSGPGRVVASDAQRDRIPRLRENLQRLRAHVPLFVADAADPPLRAGSAACVLLDVPCSATGTIARHPDARWRLTPERIAWLVRLQARILEGAAPVVQPGGLLVYLTCSLEREENRDQIDRFLAGHPAYRREGPDLEILPDRSGTDGGYGARLRRVT